MRPTLLERIMGRWIRIQVKLGLLTYGRQVDGKVGDVTIPLGFSGQGTLRAKIFKASTGEWRDYGVIASKKPTLIQRIIYAYRVKKANKWLRS